METFRMSFCVHCEIYKVFSFRKFPVLRFADLRPAFLEISCYIFWWSMCQRRFAHFDELMLRLCSRLLWRLCGFFQCIQWSNHSFFLSLNIIIKIFDEITRKYQFFEQLDINSKILFLFNSIDTLICRSVAAFVYEIMNSRYKKLYRLWNCIRS